MFLKKYDIILNIKRKIIKLSWRKNKMIKFTLFTLVVLLGTAVAYALSLKGSEELSNMIMGLGLTSYIGGLALIKLNQFIRS